MGIITKRCIWASKIHYLNDVLAAPRDDSILLNFWEPIAMLAPLIKNNSFEDEKEWRLISRPISSSRLAHRRGRSMIAPYFRLSIGNDQHFDCLAEVVVGPTPHPELSKASVDVITSSRAC